MARITKSEQALIPNIQVLMPETLVKSLDQDEVSDRVHYARELMTKAAAATDPTLKQSWSKLAGAVLRAPKRRTEIEKQVEDLRIKAKLSWSPVSAAQLRDEADRVLAANPTAPRRQEGLRKALRKAAVEGMTAVYDADGNLVGVCDPAKITGLIQSLKPAAKGDPAPAGQTELGTPKQPASASTPAANTPADVTKAAPRLRGIVVRRPI